MTVKRFYIDKDGDKDGPSFFIMDRKTGDQQGDSFSDRTLAELERDRLNDADTASTQLNPRRYNDHDCYLGPAARQQPFR